MRGREGRGRAKPIPLATVWEPLAKVTVGKSEVVVIEKKRSLLLDRWSDAPESRIQGPREDVWVRQAEALSSWATEAIEAWDVWDAEELGGWGSGESEDWTDSNDRECGQVYCNRCNEDVGLYLGYHCVLLER